MTLLFLLLFFLNIIIKFIEVTLVVTCKLQAYDSITDYLYAALCAHHPNSSLLPSPYIWPHLPSSSSLLPSPLVATYCCDTFLMISRSLIQNVLNYKYFSLDLDDTTQLIFWVHFVSKSFQIYKEILSICSSA